MSIKYFSYPININSILHLVRQVNINKSPCRLMHNFFLKNISIKGATIDLGSGKHSSYLNFIIKKKSNIFFSDKDQKNEENYFKLDFEKKLNLKKKFDTVILFNVLEHIQNYKNLLSEIYRILKKNGSLEIYTPFMHRYHPDPQDIFRPTHYYLSKILQKIGFTVNVTLIGVGPFAVCSEILFKYLRFKILKIILVILFLLLDKLIYFFSKDFKTYYLGVHCSCKKNN
jgi:SAM-dependent methyltransferase